MAEELAGHSQHSPQDAAIRQGDELAVARFVLSGAADGIFLLDSDGCTTFVNPVGERMFGWTAAELQGRKLHDVVHYKHPDGTPYPMSECPLGHVFVSGEALDWHEDTFFRRDGSPVDVACSNGALTGEDGIRGSILIIRNITRRKKAERALLENEERLRAITNSIDHMIWTTFADGYHDYFSQQWYDFTGVPEGGTDGARWTDVLHPDDAERASATWMHSLATGQPYNIEYRLRHRTGLYRWVLARANPIRDAGSRIVRWYGTCTDIQHLKDTERLLAQSTALLGLVGESLPDLMFATDFDGRLLYANKAFMDLTGGSREDLIGKPVPLESWNGPSGQTDADARKVIDIGETIEFEESWPGPDGAPMYFRAIRSPLRDANGSVIGVVGISSDMTARRAAEERERLLAREVDHRARNLLAVVQSLVQLTRAPDMATYAKAIKGRIHALARAHGLLSSSRWEGAALDVLVNEELAPYRGLGAGRVDAHGPPVLLRPDAAQAIALALHELATNAAKHGALSADKGHLAVDWWLAPASGGRDELVLRWVEERGPQVTLPKRKGFGSTVLQASVERQLRGRVVLDWRPEGLIVEIALPADQLLAGKAGELTESLAPLPIPAVTARPEARTVLIVEDEGLIALQAEQALSEAGHTVIGPAARIGDAFDLIHKHQDVIDAALLDVNVAGSRSFAIADILVDKDIPFAFVTGYDPASTLPARYRTRPAISKPFKSADLATLVGRLQKG